MAYNDSGDSGYSNEAVVTMGNDKIFLFPYVTGETITFRFFRFVDSYWLNDADGSFDSSPADKDVLTAEIGTLGVFYLKESRSEWDDGEYVGICVDAAGNNVGTTDSFWVIDDVIQGTGNFATHESVAAIQADSTSILTDTNEIQGKLPVAYIMGSAVTTSQDSKITDIKTKTDLYLDAAVSTRATAAVCTEGRLAELDATNLPADIDTLIARLTALRAGYLDNLSGGAVALASVCTDARLSELAAANLPADIDSLHESVAAIQADSTSILTDTNEIQGKLPVAYIMGSAVTTSQDSKITDIKTKTDLYLDAAVSTRATAAVCTEGRLAELDATNLPADIDTLIARLTALRAGYLDNLSGGAVALASVCTDARLSELAAANLPADIDSLLARLTAGRATNLDNLDATISSVSTLITRALGIAGENQYVDNYVYTDGKLTSSRLRIYSLAASVGTAANVTATYTITATYGTSGVTTLSIVKV
jgi:hypothetical protein